MGIKCLLRMRGCRECLIWGDRFRHANSHVTSGHLFINNNNNNNRNNNNNNNKNNNNKNCEDSYGDRVKLVVQGTIMGSTTE